MDPEEFRKFGKQMIDYVADYWLTMRERKPMPNVNPGYLKELLPPEAPYDPECMSEIFKDLESVVMQGVSQGMFNQLLGNMF